MKKLFVCIIFVFVLTGCQGKIGCDFEPNSLNEKVWASSDDIEKMTERQLREEVRRKGNIIVEDFHRPNSEYELPEMELFELRE